MLNMKASSKVHLVEEGWQVFLIIHLDKTLTTLQKAMML